MGLLSSMMGSMAEAGSKVTGDYFARQDRMEEKEAERKSAFLQQVELMKTKMEMEEGQKDKDLERLKREAPERNKLATERSVAEGMAKLDPKLVEGERAKKTGDMEAELKFKVDHISDLRRIAEASRDPTERAAAGVRLKAAQLELSQLEEKIQGGKVRSGLLNSAREYDSMGTPEGKAAAAKVRGYVDGQMSDEYTAKNGGREGKAMNVAAAREILKSDTSTEEQKTEATKYLADSLKEKGSASDGPPPPMPPRKADAANLTPGQTGSVTEPAKKTQVSQQEVQVMLSDAEKGGTVGANWLKSKGVDAYQGITDAKLKARLLKEMEKRGI